MKKVFKNILCLMLVAAMVLPTVLTAYAAGPYKDSNGVYFFDDFNDKLVNPTNANSNKWNANSASTWQYSNYAPFGRYLLGNGGNSAGSPGLEGEEDVDTYVNFAYEMQYNKTVLITQRKNPVASPGNGEIGGTNAATKTVDAFNIGDWKTFSGTLMVTTDIKVPMYSGSNNADYTLRGYIAHVYDNDGAGVGGGGVRNQKPKYVAAPMAEITVASNNKVYANGNRVSGVTPLDQRAMNDSLRTELTGVQPGNWIQLQTIIDKKDDGTYTVYQYVNGILVNNGENTDVVGQEVDPSTTKFIENAAASEIGNYYGIGVEFRMFCSDQYWLTHTKNPYVGIDNIKFVKLGDTAGVKASSSVSGATDNKAVIYFEQSDDDFEAAGKTSITTASGQKALKSAAIAQQGKAITVERFNSATGEMEAVSDFEDTNWGVRVTNRTTPYSTSNSFPQDIPVRPATIDGTTPYMETIIPNATELHLKNLGLTNPDDKAIVTIKGKDLLGNPVDERVVVYNMAKTSGIVAAEFKDFEGAETGFGVGNASTELEVAPSTSEILLYTPDTTNNSAKVKLQKQGEGDVWSDDSSITVSYVDGKYKLVGSGRCLEQDKMYRLMYDGVEFMTFKSGQGEGLKIFNERIESGVARFSYVNTGEAASVYAVTTAYDAYDAPVQTKVGGPYSVPAGSYGNIAVSDIATGSTNVKLLMLRNIAESYGEYTTDTAKLDVDYKIDADGKFIVTGETTEENSLLVWYKTTGYKTGNPEMVYAVHLDNPGAFEVALNGVGAATAGTYDVVLYDGVGGTGYRFKNKIAYTTLGDYQTAVGLLNGATTAEAVAGVLTAEYIDLNLTHPVFDPTDTALVAKVAEYVLNYKTKKGNFADASLTDMVNTRLILTECLAAAAFECGESVSIKDFEADITWLYGDTLFKEWLNRDTAATNAVTADIADSWLTNINKRLKADHRTGTIDGDTYLDNFKKDVAASIVFAVIDGPNSYNIVEELIKDFDADFINVSDDLLTYKVINNIYQAGKSYTGFLYTDLKNDMAYYATKNTSEVGGGGTGGGGGGGTGGGKVDVQIKNDVPEEPDTQEPDDTDLPNQSGQTFNDLEDVEWAVDAITALYEKNIISGNGDGGFAPNNNIKREEIVKMIVGLAELEDTDTELTFADVKSDEWYADFIAIAVKAGIAGGYSSDTFGIGDFVTRQDICVMVYNALKLKNVELDTTAAQDIKDFDDIADYAKDAVAALVNLGVVSGYEDKTFKPEGNATRAEAAKIIYGLLEYVTEPAE